MDSLKDIFFKQYKNLFQKEKNLCVCRDVVESVVGELPKDAISLNNGVLSVSLPYGSAPALFLQQNQIKERIREQLPDTIITTVRFKTI